MKVIRPLLTLSNPIETLSVANFRANRLISVKVFWSLLKTHLGKGEVLKLKLFEKKILKYSIWTINNISGVSEIRIAFKGKADGK